MNVLVEGSTPASVATQANLNSWINRIAIPYTATLDTVAPQPTMEIYFGAPRDQFVIIDLTAMKFVSIYDADPMGAINEVKGYLSSSDAGM